MPSPRASQNSTDLVIALGEAHQDVILSLGATGTRQSLMETPQEDWPREGVSSDLATFATNRQAYTGFLGLLATGVRLTTVAMAFGVRQNQIKHWMKKGADQACAGKNTIYSWFYMDCFRAHGSAKVKAEISAYQNDPLAFIARVDQGGQFNNLEGPGLEALFRADESALDEEEKQSLGSEDVLEALKAAAEKGALNVEAMIEAAQNQIPNKQ